ncbi:hypothetical protein MOX02_09670 [Methylobacterium oxalidis]|uniref:Uncharacterized protein n=2 Tax=Methylobacterium oxalidis TaxID=944322 RepID=A0A512IZ86_9HYPH|nr:hypothetical protein MOX02_09670 [Methylobacterium oxalidis]GJE30284.1 hypothetical protein LDDCCGHA_0450 [Methylobacterium oxalidis]GLS65862.1 hypothetical protein GCM10007888_42440 [Methylobacterium oxalidis]
MLGEMVRSLIGRSLPDEEAPRAEPAAGRTVGARPDARTPVIDGIGQKVLHAWLQNRHQTLVPLTLNLRSLQPEERALVLRVVAAAVAAGGRAPDLDLADAALARIGARDEDRRALRAALEAGEARGLYEAVQAAGIGTVAYGAALLAVDQRSRLNQLFLAWLAARLAVSDDAAASLHRRYRV